MKRLISAAAAATMLLASALPALADDHGRDHGHRDARAPHRQYASAHRYREGQMYHGHPLHYRGGHWGYYRPQNGSRIFINIPL